METFTYAMEEYLRSDANDDFFQNCPAEDWNWKTFSQLIPH
jgi:hypothetical protein